MIVDILSLNRESRPVFTVDNTQTNLSLILSPAAANDWYFENADLDYILPIKENFNILSLGIVLPYCFRMANSYAFLRLEGYDEVLGGTIPIPQIDGNTGEIKVPFDSHEWDVNIYVPWFNINENSTSLVLSRLEIDISMIGAPDSLNEQELGIDVFLKIQHTLPLFK